MKQILQNVVNFEKPKVVLARYNSEKHVPLLMEIGGYIIAMKYDEDSNICGTETVYFDRFGKIDLGIQEIIMEFTPGETITLEELDKRLEDQSNYSIEGICYGLSDYYNTYYGSVNFTQRLNELGINIKYPENLYSENTTLGYTIIVKKESDMLRITAISKQYHGIGNFEEYRSLFYYNLSKTVDSGKLIEIVTDRIVSCAIYERNRLGFKYNIKINECMVRQVRRRITDNDKLEKLIKKSINDALKKRGKLNPSFYFLFLKKKKRIAHIPPFSPNRLKNAKSLIYERIEVKL